MAKTTRKRPTNKKSSTSPTATTDTPAPVATPVAETSSKNGSNGASHAVGAQVKITEDDGATIRQSESQIRSFQRNLGSLRTDYLRKELELVRAITASQTEYETLVLAIGKKEHLNIGPGSEEAWRFLIDEMAFQRTA